MGDAGKQQVREWLQQREGISASSREGRGIQGSKWEGRGIYASRRERGGPCMWSYRHDGVFATPSR